MTHAVTTQRVNSHPSREAHRAPVDAGRRVLACVVCVEARRWRGLPQALASGWTRTDRGWVCGVCAPQPAQPRVTDSTHTPLSDTPTAQALVAHVARLVPRGRVSSSRHAYSVTVEWSARAEGLEDLRALRAEGWSGGLIGGGDRWIALVYQRARGG